MRGADKGYTNDAAPIYAEFVTRMGLKKLGYTDTIDDLDCFTAECFAIIGNELIKLQNEALEKAKKGSKKRG